MDNLITQPHLSYVLLMPYVLLICAQIVALSGRIKIAWGLLAALIVWSVSVGLIAALGVLFIVALCAAALWWKSVAESTTAAENTQASSALIRRVISIAAFSVLFILSVLFLIHKVPGFAVNTEIIPPITLGHAAGEYTLRWSLDKPLFALVMLAVGLIAASRLTPKEIAVKTLVPLIATLSIVLGLGVLFGFIAWDPKLPPQLALWGISNFFATCLAEELFFRGLIQQRLQQIFKNVNYGHLIAITLTAALFGASHAGGGALYTVLATIAGLGYGWTYYRTGSILAATTVHAALNIFHLVFFTYPYAVKLG